MDKDIGLLFPTIDFAVFFGIVFVGNWLLAPFPRRWKAFILLASYVFYAWWDWRCTPLLAVSTLAAFAGARAVDAADSDARRVAGLAASLTVQLGLLGWFVYAGFFASSVDEALRRLGMHGSAVPVVSAVLPVGLAFFTLMAMSYVIDVFRGVQEPASALDVAVYVAFFPHLVAGPIVRGTDLLPQIARSQRRDPRRIDIGRAGYLVFAGLFKAVVVASYLGRAIVNPVFGSPLRHSAPEILLALYGYALQIYADFSGYTDIAIGCALLLGFHFPQNFDRPYTAASLQEFWRRWHMTLSSWLRDYLYVPLGGNRRGRLVTARNILITMVLGGLWHGPAWTFVAWGGIHASGQIVGHARRDFLASRGRPLASLSPWRRALGQFWTFQFVCFGWLFFRAGSMHEAAVLLHRLATTWGEPAPLVRLPVVAVILGMLALQYLPPGLGENLQLSFSNLRLVTKGVVLGVALLLITTLGPSAVPPFVLYRF